MYETTVKTRALGLRRSAARKARVVLATALVTAALVAPPLVAGLVVPPPAHAATTTPHIVVNDTHDFDDTNPGDGVCDFSAGSDEPCSLRAAIQEANSRPGPDVIDFSVPEGQLDPVTGVANIKPQSALPDITDQVTINGYTQPGSSPNTRAVGDDAVLKVELDGTNVPGTIGLTVLDSSNSVIKGLAINRFFVGIDLLSGTSGNRVEGNFIGTDPTGTLDRGNGHGVVIGPSSSSGNNVIGGSTPEKRNVISGNTFDGVFLSNDTNLVQGNYVGTDKSGTKALSNGSGRLGSSDGGVAVFDADNTISGNVVSGNNGSGIYLGSKRTKVLGNRIGTTASGPQALGNLAGGVTVNANNSLIGDGTAAGSNTIAFNAQDGVQINGVLSGNTVSRDSIFANGGLGVDLIGPGESDLTNVSTPNDPGDTDLGANNLQNKPVVSSAKTSSTGTAVKGTLSSTPNKTFVVRLYSNPAGGDEGKRFLGQLSVSTGGKGNASFSKSLPKVAVGNTVTATATSLGGDTSEFSAPRTVTSA